MMRMKWLALALMTCVSVIALSAGAAFASWGGGTGDDAVEVVGNVTLVDSKYYITGDLAALGDDPSDIVSNAEGSGTWLLDFGRQDYYLPGDFEEGSHTIQGKLCQGGEMDVFVVDGDSVGRPEGGRPAGFPPPGWHPHGGPPGHDGSPPGGPPGQDGHPQGGPPGQGGNPQNGPPVQDGHPHGGPPGLTDHPKGGPPGLADHPKGGPPGLA